MSRSDVLVDADWAEAHLDDPKVVFVEVDEDVSAYDGGHLKNAVRLDWTEMTVEQRSSAMAKARWNVTQRPEDISVAATTRVVLVASVGLVQVMVPSRWRVLVQPHCLVRWCRRQSEPRLHGQVGPSGQARSWSWSQVVARMVQPGHSQRGDLACRNRRIRAGTR